MRDDRQNVLSDEARAQREEQQQQRREQRAERQRRRQEERRQQQEAAKAAAQQEEQQAAVPVESEDESAVEERVQVMPRRKPRQLSQKVRVESAARAAERMAEEAKPSNVEPVEPQPTEPQTHADEQEEQENRDNGNMPRRSRRSPRHLRVSGQRRRRYRDERYPTQSPMPIASGAASPEMASGKVWIRYPVAQTSNENTEATDVVNETPDYSREETAAAVALPAAASEAVAEQQQPEQTVQYAEPERSPRRSRRLIRTIPPPLMPVNEEPSVEEARVAAQAKPVEEVSVAAQKVAPAEIAPVAAQDEQQPSAIAENSAADVSEETAAQVEQVLNAPAIDAEETLPVTEPHAPVPRAMKRLSRLPRRLSLKAQRQASLPSWPVSFMPARR